MKNAIEDLYQGWVDFNKQKTFTARKRPIEVSAFQAKVRLLVHTSVGITAAEPGDYIIKGVRGEFSVGKKDTFEQTYEILSKE